MKRLFLLTAVLLFSGCATTKPLTIACISCGLLQMSGACSKEVACPAGQHKEITNYRAWLDGEEAPKIECRRWTVQ